jgi:hypothetical protein
LWGWVSARCGGVRTITSESWGVFDSHFTDAPLLKNAMVILELGGSESNQQYLEFRGDDFDADIHVEIFHEGVNQVEYLANLYHKVNLDNLSHLIK